MTTAADTERVSPCHSVAPKPRSAASIRVIVPRVNRPGESGDSENPWGGSAL